MYQGLSGDAGVIRNVRHTGIVTHNLEQMAAFYRAIGFVDESYAVEMGPFIEQVVHLDGVEVEWVKMHAPDGYLLELLQYHSHPQLLNRELAKSNDLGCSHIAFTVDDVDKACEIVEKAGGKITNSPTISPNGRVKVVYGHDPEGILIEMVEELS